MMEEILDKIKKLLALSRSANEHEAAAALAAAIKLARRNDIDLEKIRGTEFMEEIDGEDAFVKSRLERWEITLYFHLAQYFGCRILHGNKVIDIPLHSTLHERIIIYGCASDRETVIYLATYLRRQLLALWQKNKKSLLEALRYLPHHHTEYAIRRDYLRGAVSSVLNSAKEIFDRDPEGDAGNALILKKGYAVDRWIAEKINPGQMRGRLSDPGIVGQIGRRDGKDIDIRRPLDERPAPVRQRIG